MEWDDARSFLGNLRRYAGNISSGSNCDHLLERGFTSPPPSLRDHMDIKFVGLPNVDVAPHEQAELEEALEPFDCVPVFLRDDLKDMFFNGFCKVGRAEPSAWLYCCALRLGGKAGRLRSTPAKLSVLPN